jgi:hypothetical protein
MRRTQSNVAEGAENNWRMGVLAGDCAVGPRSIESIESMTASVWFL